MIDFSYKESEIHLKYYSIYQDWEKLDKFLIQKSKRMIIARL